MAEVQIKVVATDLETGASCEWVIGPGNYVILTSDPCHVSNEQHYANGTTVLTLKGRDPSLIRLALKRPTADGGERWDADRASG